MYVYWNGDLGGGEERTEIYYLSLLFPLNFSVIDKYP